MSPSERCPKSLPGFDYVHGLQGMIPRTYEETMQTFKDAEFTLVHELEVPSMFVWVVKPN